jgi:hypothetical protein
MMGFNAMFRNTSWKSRQTLFIITQENTAILTALHCFPQSLHANAGIFPLLGLDHFIPNSLQFTIINHLTIGGYVVLLLRQP